MNAAVEQVKIFRRKLVQAREKVQEIDTHGSNFTAAILLGLIVDFENLFSKEIYDAGAGEDVQIYIDRFCIADKDKCPICGGALVKRKAKATKKEFLGCKAFPRCRGTREIDGTISLSREIRAFLAYRCYQEAQKKEADPLNRFSELECD